MNNTFLAIFLEMTHFWPFGRQKPQNPIFGPNFRVTFSSYKILVLYINCLLFYVELKSEVASV